MGGWCHRRGFGFERESKWDEIRSGGTGDLEEWEGRPSLCSVSGGPGCLDKNWGFMRWFTHKLQKRQREKGIQTKMRVKLSAKMLGIAWTLMKKKEPSSPNYLNL